MTREIFKWWTSDCVQKASLCDLFWSLYLFLLCTSHKESYGLLIVTMRLLQGGYYRNIGNSTIMAIAALGLFSAAGGMHVLKRWGKQPYQNWHKLWLNSGRQLSIFDALSMQTTSLLQKSKKSSTYRCTTKGTWKQKQMNN